MPKDLLAPLGTSGPMCKYAKDLRPFLKLLVGQANAQKMMLDTVPSLEKLKVRVMLALYYQRVLAEGPE